MSEIRIACEHCRGIGRRELTDVERDTRKAVGPKWSSTLDVQARLTKIQGYKTSPTALVNRLQALRLRGLVESKPISGKALQWKAVTDGHDVKGEAIEAERWGRAMRGER